MTEMIPTRDGFGKGLLELGGLNKDIVVLCADLTDSTRAGWFKEKFPSRFFEFGVAEQDMFGAAAGLALMGKIPFACTFGVFASGRAWDQIRVSIASMRLNVKIIGTHGGVAVGEDGATHQSNEEIALMRVLPNMTMVVPADAHEAKKATIQAALDIKGPVYIRLGRSPSPVISKESDVFKIGKANIVREGSDVTIIACGLMVHEGLLACDELAKQGIRAALINLHTPKPLDKETILAAARKTKAIVTAEEHLLFGGMGSAVAEFLSQNFPVPIKMVGIDDRFGESGKPAELFKALKLTSADIVKAAGEAIRMKS
ncbi:MAG: transketolase family protein [Candidatus Omnitrophica bacterium]|nr:transketolase family protein [Candidatus Omnitrophota bacterium]